MSLIEKILTLVRSANKDEFNEQISKGNDLEAVYEEINYLTKKHTEEKKRKKEIVEHLSDSFSGNYYNQLPISKHEDELDVISMAFNTYIEEIEEKTISRDYFVDVLNAIPQNILVFDEEGNIDYINELGKDYFENSNPIHKINHLPEKISSQFYNFITNNLRKFDFEVKLQSQIKPTVYLLCSFVRIHFINKDQILLIARDITEQRNEGYKILKATLHGQDLERKRLAYDLHDSLGQELNAIKMYLNALENMDNTTLQYKKVMIDIRTMLNDSINSIQDITFNLMPVILENNALSASIDQLINRLNLIHNNIQYTKSNENIRLKEKKDELFVYRIIQEFVNNSIKYANAESIKISISENKELEEITIHLEDNGIGFDMKNSNSKNGINNIKYRLKTLNTIYTYRSSIGNGTELKFTIYEKNLENSNS
jgi:signal transduction histidine kinase